MGKGADFERRICKELSKWFTKGMYDDVFWRTPMSGGRATVRRKHAQRADVHDSDICAVREIGTPFTDMYSCECKSGYGRWDVLDVVEQLKKNPELVKFYLQARAAAKPLNKSVILIVQRNRKPPVVFLSRSGYVRAADRVAHCPQASVTLRLKKKPVRLYALSWKDFLANAVPEEMIAK